MSNSQIQINCLQSKVMYLVCQTVHSRGESLLVCVEWARHSVVVRKGTYLRLYPQMHYDFFLNNNRQGWHDRNPHPERPKINYNTVMNLSDGSLTKKPWDFMSRAVSRITVSLMSHCQAKTISTWRITEIMLCTWYAFHAIMETSRNLSKGIGWELRTIVAHDWVKLRVSRVSSTEWRKNHTWKSTNSITNIDSDSTCTQVQVYDHRGYGDKTKGYT